MICTWNKAGERSFDNFHPALMGPQLTERSVMYKLFLKSFPNHFKPDSIYCHMPMTIRTLEDMSSSFIVTDSWDSLGEPKDHA